MVVDRFGNPVRIGWSAHHILWIRAAMSLEKAERHQAYRDIAELTGRSYRSVWQLSCMLERDDNIRRRRELITSCSKEWLARQAAE